MVSNYLSQPDRKRNGSPASGGRPARSDDAGADYERAKGACLADAAGGEDRVELCVKLAAIASEAGKPEEAIEALNAALAMDPRCGEAYGSLAMIHQKRQNYGQAVEMYLKCLELDGDNLIALLGLFQTCCKMGTFAIIIHYLEIYLGGHPRDVAVLFCLATLHARDGKLQKARQALGVILSLQPANSEAVALLRQVEVALARGPTCRELKQ